MDKSVFSTPPGKPQKPKYGPKKSIRGDMRNSPPAKKGCAVVAVALVGGLTAVVGALGYGAVELAKAVL